MFDEVNESVENIGKELSEKLSKKWDNAWKEIKEEEKELIDKLGEEYRKYISEGKTERLCAKMTVDMAEDAGFRPLKDYIQKGSIKPGDKIYVPYKNKTVILFVIGEKDFQEGLNIVGAHIDSPRLDLKQSPLYEKDDLAWFKTHYYGGIKKYQWVTIPLALHGVVVTKEGKTVDISIGEKHGDPVFCVTDLLPHLSKEQYQKKLPEAITGEGLNLVVGSIPYTESEVKEPVKLAVLQYLNDEYGMIEEDFASAELEAVPAGSARYVGFDKSMIGGYGQDDRICAFTATKSILDMKDTPKNTSVVILADKEEIGSYGNTGMDSMFFENMVAELVHLADLPNKDLVVRRTLMNSEFLSADVNAAVDANFSGTHDTYNASYLNKGVVMSKYTGARGKSGSNDAHAEFVGKIRKIFNDNSVRWQMGELGKVDLGGGGTIAFILAKYGMDVIDCGPCLLSMHAPFEISGKIDVYMTYKGYKAFLEQNA
jgi:aspartyl aminopeptidase